ncbi:hypothetical protein CAPTEDRAFT_224195 [Capitella teleta]|uniref:acylglycerol lipase n=1 Tax=Capitella teleta TaxID=283909 RepID=R7UA57_CAPTE|nr:hypothetical protein CAPTEDRAFT_224195 [Capitella teleta]|eukprot:ELU00698.1 hypothetical protein CAPTEDRAFT_224195 [Capitella teleta]
MRVKCVRGKQYSYAYAERGAPSDREPSLVFVHGFSASKDNWSALFKRIPRTHHIVAVDLLGHGESSVPTDPSHTTVDCLVDHLHEHIQLVPQLTDRPFHMIGTSMGGLLTAAYSAKYPQEVLKATLICPGMKTPVLTEFMKNAGEASEGEANLLLPETTADIQKMMNACFYDKKKVVTNKQIMLGVLQLRAPKETFNKLCGCLYFALLTHMTDRTNEAENEVKFETLMKNIRAPTQIVWGENDQLIHISGVDRLKTLIPNIKRVDIIPECGHAVHWDQPSKLTSLLLSFYHDSDQI